MDLDIEQGDHVVFLKISHRYATAEFL